MEENIGFERALARIGALETVVAVWVGSKLRSNRLYLGGF